MKRQIVLGSLTLVAALMLVLTGDRPSEAKLFGEPPVPAVAPAHVLPATDCCPPRCIDYRHHRTLRKICCACGPDIQTVLLVEDPSCCNHCPVEVPVCLPACCDGPPQVKCHKGLFGRGVVTYTWCCGYRIRIVFDRCGDVTVHSYGS